MGFKKDVYASVWGVEEGKNGSMRVRITTSHKNSKTGEYEQDFSGFCTFYGAAAEKAVNLKEKDRIKLGDVDVTTWYDKIKQKEYINYRVFDFEPLQGTKTRVKQDVAQNIGSTTDANDVAQGEIDEDDLPF